MNDAVNHPPHYNAHPGGIECIELVERLPFCQGNAIKYLWRADHKGAARQDLQKALWYVRRARSSDAGLFGGLGESDELLLRVMLGFCGETRAQAIHAIATRSLRAAEMLILDMLAEAA